jgi:hypothetical protein
MSRKEKVNDVMYNELAKEFKYYLKRANTLPSKSIIIEKYYEKLDEIAALMRSIDISIEQYNRLCMEGNYKVAFNKKLKIKGFLQVSREMPSWAIEECIIKRLFNKLFKKSI